MISRWIATAVLGLGLLMAPPGFAASKGKAKRGKTQVSGVVNLNTATPEQLKELPGISQRAVDSIIAYREKQAFTRAEELVKVKGFGAKRFEKLKSHLTTSGGTTLKVEKIAAKSRRARGSKAQGRTERGKAVTDSEAPKLD